MLLRNQFIQLSNFLLFVVQLTRAERALPSQAQTSAGHSTCSGGFRNNNAISLQPTGFMPGDGCRFATSTLALTMVLGLAILGAQTAHAQAFNVIHSFTGGGDGASPSAGLTMDQSGNFYGTTTHGGANGPSGYGIVFKLTHRSGGWTLVPLYGFAGHEDGASPEARVIIGPDGTLYGTTASGGGNGCGGNGCGTVFNLRPPTNASANVLGGWTESVLYRFRGGSDGALPAGDLVFDSSGNIYGTTAAGGASQDGTVYELTPSDGSWTESVLRSFTGGSDGGNPTGGVLFDASGNVYGTTQLGGSHSYGSVFQLVRAGSGWSLSTLYSFQGTSDGANPDGALIFDAAGNLYGTTISNGVSNGGTVFALTPQLNGTWVMTVLYALTGQSGGGSQASLTLNASGDLYGTTYKDGAYRYGSVLTLTPSNGGWGYADLHDFTFGDDGAQPVGNMILDANGNLYGTTLAAGEYGYGVIFEITPVEILNTSLPAGTVNYPYQATLSAMGGLPPYSWSVIQGSLPQGLTLNSNGVISGMPTAAGTFNFTVQVSDSESPPVTAVAPLSVTVESALLITTTSLPAGAVDSSYNATLAAIGGLPPYSWSVIQGSLPNGLALSANSGLISGTPTLAGTFTFTAQVSDSQSPPDRASAPLAITVNALSIFLSWDASTSPGVIGYNAYRGTTSGGPYTKLNASLISNTSYSDQTVLSGHTYYYVTTAVNSLGLESVYSNQAVSTLP